MAQFALTNVRIHMNVVDHILNQQTGPVYRLVERTSDRTEGLSRQFCPVETGDMVARHRMRMRVRRFIQVQGRVFNTDPAAWWVNTGTGQYAKFPGTMAVPPGTRDDAPATGRELPSTGRRVGSRRPPKAITPKRAQVLRFPARRFGDGILYRPWVDGQRPNEFMLRALRAATGVGVQRWTITERKA